MTDAFLEFSDIYYEDMGLLNPGRVKLAHDTIFFKNEKTGKIVQESMSSLKDVKWLRLGNRPGLKFGLDNGTKMRIGGFKESDYDKINTFAKGNWDKEVEQLELAIKGWNYGNCTVDGQTIEFAVDSKPCFDIPLSNVANCTGNKNEATLEFHQNDECPVALIEMRFHMPGDPEDEEADPVEEFRKAVMQFAGIEAETGQPVATLTQILCTTPRGRYDIKVFPTHLSLHGKTYDYKIPIKTIMRLFLVPHKDGRHVYFVISLNPPIRQGLTRYHYLVFEFLKEEQIDLELGLTEEQLKEQYGGKLERTLSGQLYEVVSKIFRVLINMKITVPGNFVGHSGTPAVMCAHRQASGFLYPLEKGFLYIHKPPMYIRFEEISSVHFARSDVSTRSFDFEIELKNGQTMVFNSVEKEEYNKLFDYVSNKGLRVRNAKKMDKGYAEDRFAGSDDEIDPYKAQVKQEGKEKREANSDDESDTDDDDYDLDEDIKRRKAARSDSEGSGSEPDEEFDSDHETDSEDSKASGGENEDDEEKMKRREKKKERKEKGEKKDKERKERKKKAADSDGEDGGGKKKTKRAKKDKDPNMPKRGQSAYFLWLNQNRSNIKKDGDSVADIAKRAGEMWKGMDEAEKKPWEAKAAEDKKRYETEMAEYRKNGGGASGGGASGSSSKKSNPTPTKKGNPSPSKAKSKEFVSDEDSSDDDKPLKAKKEIGDESGSGDSDSD